MEATRSCSDAVDGKNLFTSSENCGASLWNSWKVKWWRCVPLTNVINWIDFRVIYSISRWGQYLHFETFKIFCRNEPFFFNSSFFFHSSFSRKRNFAAKTVPYKMWRKFSPTEYLLFFQTQNLSPNVKLVRRNIWVAWRLNNIWDFDTVNHTGNPKISLVLWSSSQTAFKKNVPLLDISIGG